jgi:hypothetical protein
MDLSFCQREYVSLNFFRSVQIYQKRSITKFTIHKIATKLILLPSMLNNTFHKSIQARKYNTKPRNYLTSSPQPWPPRVDPDARNP